VHGGGRRKLIVVSNRGPAVYQRDERGERVAHRGGGGLVTALRGLVALHDVTWIASAMSDEDRVVSQDNNGGAFEETTREGSAFRYRLVTHEPQAYDWFYNVVSNPMLWFLQHYLWDLVEKPNLDQGLHHAWEEGYVAVNRNFAAAVVAELDREPDATVFFHDYHLYLAPRFVRDARPDAVLHHFVHIPWPQPDYWHVLPGPIRHQLHESLLANDSIGFHTRRWQRSFLRCCVDFVGATCDLDAGAVRYEARQVRVAANPISVDTNEFDQLAESPTVLTAESALVEERPEKLILRVDRTDPSKNIVRGFRAFELYLEEHPEMHRRVGMLALLDPSRQDIPEYAEYVGAIQREARRVNDKYAPMGWTPIDLRVADNFPGSVAAYKQYDVLLVNAIFDGLNLVAKEAPLVNTRDGVLVLSENAGAHDELGDFALTVNPFDVAGQAQAIHEALQLGEDERRRRIEGIRARVREHDLESWLERELSALPASALAREVSF
jgi:trehalose 6-phosphate synthase